MKSIKSLIGALLAMVLSTSFAFGQSAFDGFALYNKLNNFTSYLVDKDGNIAHSWSCNVACNYTVLLKPNGNIVRGGIKSNNQLNGAAVGGMVQEIDPSGNVVWEFTYSDADHVSHHDMALIGDNVLLTAWERKNSTELAGHGYTGSGTQKYVTHFIEVAQDGSGGKIVWEWHLWDHMVQDKDTSLANYGVISDHPELMNVNVQTSGGGGGPGGGADWFHVNGVDYNDSLDQIVFSSRFLREIFIIDHSTTVAEAASHAGGNAGKGGDILWRWGKPTNYGVSGFPQIPGAVHDARWIKTGRPNAGMIQIFNNEGSNGNSTVDALDPPLVGYNYTWTPGQPYLPLTFNWRHNCLSSANGQSASDRLPNGNTFVNLSGGYMYEVDSNNTTVWSYPEGPAKAFRYLCDDPGIIALLGNHASCTPTSAVEEQQFANLKMYPNPTTGMLQISGIPQGFQDLKVSVLDLYGQQIEVKSNVNRLDLSQYANGIYFVQVTLDDNQQVTRKISLVK